MGACGGIWAGVGSWGGGAVTSLVEATLPGAFCPVALM
jgi:hypothetical protein